MTNAAELPADGQADEELSRKPLRQRRRSSVDLSGNSLAGLIRESTYWVARLWFRGLFYHRTLRGRRPQLLPLIPEENWPGSYDRGVELVEGRFRFLNHTVKANAAFSEGNDAGPSNDSAYRFIASDRMLKSPTNTVPFFCLDDNSRS